MNTSYGTEDIYIYLFETVNVSNLGHSGWKFIIDCLVEIYSFTTITRLVGIFLTSVLWYYLFWKPFDWFRDLTELGYDDVLRNPRSEFKTEVAKRNAINSLREKRKQGEIPPVYPNGWFVLLESEDVPVKTAKEVNALGLNLVAWRGESGKSYVADAYCPHLGAHLGVGGKVNGECIKCPFHGWAFEGKSGCLKNIPYSDSTPEFAKIKIWKTVERNGFIYLWFHAEGSEPTWEPEIIPGIEDGSWKYRGRSEFRVGCHVQEIPENGADIAHLNIVHDMALMCGGEPDHSWFNWDFIKHKWDGKWRPSDEPGQEHVAIMNLTHEMCLLGKVPLFTMNVEVKQYGPGTVSLEFVTTFGRGILFHCVTPLEPLVQRVVHRFYSENALIHPYGKLILLGEAIMIERDIRIWNRKMYIRRPILIKEDRMIKSFRKWYSQFYSENSPRHYFAKHGNGNDSNGNLSLDF